MLNVYHIWGNIQDLEALSLTKMYSLHNKAVDPLQGRDGDDPVLQ